MICIIPARLESTRLPRKLLLDATGKPLIQHTYENAMRIMPPETPVIVATDSDEIAERCHEFNAIVCRTGYCDSGTDRCFECMQQYPTPDLVINVQGDEPELPLQTVDRLTWLMELSDCGIGTACAKTDSAFDLAATSVVKVAARLRPKMFGDAYWFSRHPISNWLHIGVYAYRPSALAAMALGRMTDYEYREKLEQLRALELGIKVGVVQVDDYHVGIDTQQDYDAFVERCTVRT